MPPIDSSAKRTGAKKLARRFRDFATVFGTSAHMQGHIHGYDLPVRGRRRKDMLTASDLVAAADLLDAYACGAR